jgi:hypothetical protein
LYPVSTLGESSLPSTTCRQIILSAALKGGVAAERKDVSWLVFGRPRCSSGGLVFAVILYVLEDPLAASPLNTGTIDPSPSLVAAPAVSVGVQFVLVIGANFDRAGQVLAV